MILALTGVPLVIVSIIAFILILGVIVLVHEGGHFLLAKRAGILCHEFSIGMGPAIYKKKYKETTFCIRAIPIGGYVSMAGEDIIIDQIKVNDEIGVNLLYNQICEIVLDSNLDAMIKGKVVDFDLTGKDSNVLYITLNDGMTEHYFEVMRDAQYVFNENEKLQITPYDRSFDSKTLLQRFLTLFAGPFMNMILALLIYAIISFATGVPNYDSNRIGSVSTENSSLVSEDGSYKLQDGDEILSVNGVEISSWNELSTELDKLLAESKTALTLKIKRDEEIIDLEIDAYVNIVSLGLTNIQVSDEPFPEGISGVRVGLVGLRYLDSENKGEYPLQKGDIITKIRADKLGANNSVIKGEVIDISSWNQLISIFKDLDVANVYFEYYSYAKEGIVSIDDCAALQTYGNEILDNQRIDKIAIKVGISPEMHFDLFGCLGTAFASFWNDFTLIFRTLGLLIAPSATVKQVGIQDLSSFVGIFSLVQTFVASGILTLLAFTAMLSVNIGVMNLLPIPALDGGRIVFLGYEFITRKKPSKKVETILNNVFFILLMILFVFVTYNDIIRLIKG